MPGELVICDTRRIELFLEDQLDHQEQSALAHHLESCPACRRQLETRAADLDIWREVREHLRDSELWDGPLDPAATTPLDGEVHAAAGDTAADVRLGFLLPSDDPRMLGRFGGYEIAGLIGYGGMGVVLKGLDTALNRYVAIKVLSPHLAASGAARQRFAREAQAAAAVVHENVIAIYGVSQCQGLPFFIMSYIRGPSLQKRLDQQGPCSTAEVLRIAMQTATGLAAAHAQGLVHRDIKPANVLLADGVERVTITDFGLARAADDASLTRSGVIAGTPQFMSPEQARGEAVDARSDLFSLGSLMYAMCTGRPPFRADTSLGVLRQIAESSPRPIREIKPDVPQWMVNIIGHLHEKDPCRRIASAEQLAGVLQRCLAHVQQPDVVQLPAECQRVDKPLDDKPDKQAFCRRAIQKWPLAICAMLLLVVCGIVLHVSRGTGHVILGSATHRFAEPANGSRSSDRSTASSAWNDGARQQIESARQRIAALRRDTQQFWTTPAFGELSDDNTTTSREKFE